MFNQADAVTPATREYLHDGVGQKNLLSIWQSFSDVITRLRVRQAWPWTSHTRIKPALLPLAPLYNIFAAWMYFEKTN